MEDGNLKQEKLTTALLIANNNAEMASNFMEFIDANQDVFSEKSSKKLALNFINHLINPECDNDSFIKATNQVYNLIDNQFEQNPNNQNILADLLERHLETSKNTEEFSVELQNKFQDFAQALIQGDKGLLEDSIENIKDLMTDSKTQVITEEQSFEEQYPYIASNLEEFQYLAGTEEHNEHKLTANTKPSPVILSSVEDIAKVLKNAGMQLEGSQQSIDEAEHMAIQNALKGKSNNKLER